jgi:hypothetical protein
LDEVDFEKSIQTTTLIAAITAEVDAEWQTSKALP